MLSRSTKEKIYRYKLLQAASSQHGKLFFLLSAEQQFQIEQITRQQIEIENLVLASPEARSLVIATEQTEAAMTEIIARYPSKNEFKRELKQHQLDLASLRLTIHRELWVTSTLDRVAMQVSEVSATDARLFYYFHPEKFQRPETRTARHILLTINPEFPENTRAQAMTRLTLIAKRLRKNPSRFSEQAGKHSECPTAMEGGLLGRVSREQLFPALDKVLFTLPVGQVSEVVESPLGFHILLCETIHPATVIEIEDVLASIIEKLTARKRKKHQQQWLRLLSCSSRQREQRQSPDLPTVEPNGAGESSEQRERCSEDEWIQSPILAKA